ncbi:MAG: hypothetical protein QN122_07250 [Armatimonadota bacterium]|nr:hypothetical protein [Armatimonadota bacterium]MDR7449115.1 hypothetical protein [Armatimonadota bacterium]MDR7459193.1 hypothetical protein [Armatimonadota bacterium]MDR7480465.1 hypothetical protein [Armatimonadota bacterium]MDR7489207.1 hypothetical protein [Armatimonadota bacterium]
MQLNIYVPADKQALLRDLDEASRKTGRPKNDLVLEALGRYLAAVRPRLGRYRLGKVQAWRRAELYARRLSR